MTELVRYEAARRALAEACSIDEVKDIRDKAVAMQAYARQAKDSELIDDATEIRLRAERRVGELLAEMAERGERRGQGGDSEGSTAQLPKLKDWGVTKTESSRWQKLAELDDEAFEDRVEKAKRSARMTAPERAEEKKGLRQEREIELGASQRAMPTKQYGVIYADPPWRFEPYSRDTGMDRAADNHYPTMTPDEIQALEIPAADDSVLFLWATAPMLVDALVVLDAWGFLYKSHCVWAKDKAGTGYWFRNQHEILLIGVRGHPPAPAPGTQIKSIVHESVGRHSEKPMIFYEIIEAYFPTLPKIELYARSHRSGWDAWGLEAPESAYAQ